MKLRYKKDNKIIEVADAKVSTNLFIEDTEIFEDDILVWTCVSLTNNEICEYECRVIWSNQFNGWSLIRVEVFNDLEIPIGEYGIPIEELNLL